MEDEAPLAVVVSLSPLADEGRRVAAAGDCGNGGGGSEGVRTTRTTTSSTTSLAQDHSFQKSRPTLNEAKVDTAQRGNITGGDGRTKEGGRQQAGESPTTRVGGPAATTIMAHRPTVTLTSRTLPLAEIELCQRTPRKLLGLME